MIPFALPQMFSCLLPYFIYACSLMVFLQKSYPWLCYASHFALIYTLSPHFILAENNIYLKVTSWCTFIYYLLSLLDTQLLGTRISHNLLTWNLWTVWYELILQKYALNELFSWHWKEDYLWVFSEMLLDQHPFCNCPFCSITSQGSGYLFCMTNPAHEVIVLTCDWYICISYLTSNKKFEGM